MDRRGFIKNTGTLIAGAALAPYALPEVYADMPTSDSSGRLILPMNRNWRYSRTVVEGGHAKDFDDSAFERVVIPHTNVRLPWHGFDEKTYEFVSLYRRRFKVPSEARSKRVFVDFEGVMTASTVWINGQRVGEYKGGYTPFSFDLTPHLDFDGDNALAVDVDSSERADIPPFGYEIDYLTFGGIYREVWLRIVPATFIENIFARPKDVLTSHPGLDVDCFIQHSEPSSGLTLEVQLLDGDRLIAKASQSLPPAAVSGEPATHTVQLENLKGINSGISKIAISTSPKCA
jgi:beta-galactosidase